MAYAEMLWADRLGIYLRAARQDGSPAIDLRVPFVRAVEDEREARSALTMMAQVAWEAQRWVPSRAGQGRAGQGRAGRRAGERLGMRWGVPCGRATWPHSAAGAARSRSVEVTVLTSFLLLLSLQAVHAPGCAQAPAAGCRQQLMSQLALCYAFKQPSVACHSCMP
jgi:hypothetical protein